MSYGTVHRANENFQIAVLFILLGTFFLALALMFVHPAGSLAVFFAGLVVAGVAAIIGRGFRRAENRAVRRESAGPSDR